MLCNLPQIASQFLQVSHGLNFPKQIIQIQTCWLKSKKVFACSQLNGSCLSADNHGQNTNYTILKKLRVTFLLYLMFLYTNDLFNFDINYAN